LPPAAFEALALSDGLPATLAGLGRRYDVVPLVRLLAFGYVRQLGADPKYAEGLTTLLGDHHWPLGAMRPLAHEVAAATLAACRQAIATSNGADKKRPRGSASSDEKAGVALDPDAPLKAPEAPGAALLEASRGVLGALWQRFPDETGAAIEDAMCEAEGTKGQAGKLFALLEGTLMGRAVFGPGGGSLQMALQHPSAAVRVQAAARAEQVLLRDGSAEGGGSEGCTEDDGLGQALLRRLEDEDASVVAAVLSRKALAAVVAAAAGQPAVGSELASPADASLTAVRKWRHALCNPHPAAPPRTTGAALATLLRFLAGPLLAAHPEIISAVVSALLLCFPGTAVAAATRIRGKAVRKPQRKAVVTVCATAVSAAAATGHLLFVGLEGVAADMTAASKKKNKKGEAKATAAAAAGSEDAAGGDDAVDSGGDTGGAKPHQRLDDWADAVKCVLVANVAESSADLDIEELLGSAGAEDDSCRLIAAAVAGALRGDNMAPSARQLLARRTAPLLARRARGAAWAMRGLAATIPALPQHLAPGAVVWAEHAGREGQHGPGGILSLCLLASAGAQPPSAPTPADAAATAKGAKKPSTADGEGPGAIAAAASAALGALLEHQYRKRPLAGLLALAASAGTAGGAQAAAAVRALCVSAAFVEVAAGGGGGGGGSAKSMLEVAADATATLPCALLCLGNPQQEVREAAVLYATAAAKFLAACEAGAAAPTPAKRPMSSRRKDSSAAAPVNAEAVAALDAALGTTAGAAVRAEDVDAAEDTAPAPLVPLDFSTAAVLLRALTDQRAEELALDTDCLRRCL
ncbi:unnamed protein product, partial [Phaeothamnion confervicola]